MNYSSYHPRFFEEDNIFEAKGILGWLGKKRKIAICSGIIAAIKQRDHLKILDVGCRYGGILREFKRAFTIGIDINYSALKKAKEKDRESIFIQCDAKNLPFKSEIFDFVVCSEVLEHVDSPVRLADQVTDVSREGGFIYITVPNELITTIGRFLLKKKPYKSLAHKTVFSFSKLRTLFPYSLVKKINIPFACMPFCVSTNMMVCFRKL